jgi:demethoxyubiquinone hydroxylase (CLK1/Coq7/Cat5 family)
MDREDTRQRLIAMLRSAYSGERAAALAYRAHATALSDARERAAIENIEREEWAHRADVGELLSALGAKPAPLREAVMAAIGRGVGVTCHLGNRIAPMYFAGRIEHANIVEYDDGARYARELGLVEHERRLSAMAATEREHEAFFLRTVAAHPWLPLLKRLFHWG